MRTHPFLDMLKATMKAERITQTQLAVLMGVTQPAVSQILNGKVSPTMYAVDRMVTALGYRLALERVHSDPLDVPRLELHPGMDPGALWSSLDEDDAARRVLPEKEAKRELMIQEMRRKRDEREKRRAYTDGK